MFDFLKRKANSLEQQLKVLAKGGITLDPAIGLDEIFVSYSREQFEKDPYRRLLCALGDDVPSASRQIWHFDTECIEDHGDYGKIAHRLTELAEGALPLENIEDFVDIDNGVAWLSFVLDGQDYKWTATVQDDWVDPKILSRFAELLEAGNAGRRFTYFDLLGQDCLIGCSTPQQRAWLEAETGLKVQWLR